MIPIRNRKKTLKVTVEEMRNFAFAYVEKYAPSKQQLKTYLLKKYLKSSVPNVKKQDVTDLIDIVLSDLEKNKFVNDTTMTSYLSISDLQQDAKENVDILRCNLSKLDNRGDKIHEMEVKTDFLSKGAEKFNRRSRLLKDKIFWANVVNWVLVAFFTNGTSASIGRLSPIRLRSCSPECILLSVENRINKKIVGIVKPIIIEIKYV